MVHSKQSFVTVILLCFVLVLGAFAVFLGLSLLQMSADLRQRNMIQSQKLTGKPQNILASPTPSTSTSLHLTTFQKALHDNCIEGKISLGKLPIIVNFNILKKRMDNRTYESFFAQQEKEQKIGCSYDRGSGGYAFVGDNGNGGILRIFDIQSPDPHCMGCYGFRKGNIILSNGFSLTVLSPSSDAPLKAEDVNVTGLVVKTINLTEQDEVSIDSMFELIDRQDARLQRMLAKYPTGADIRDKGSEVLKDIISTFFVNPATLQQPEKNKLENEQLLISAFSIIPTPASRKSTEGDLLKDYSNCLTNTTERTNKMNPLEVLSAIRKLYGNFSNPIQTQLSWYTSGTDTNRNLTGYGVSAVMSSAELPNTFFTDSGFSPDNLYNSGSATSKGVAGYYKDCVVCKDSSQAVNPNRIDGDYRVDIACAILK